MTQRVVRLCPRMPIETAALREHHCPPTPLVNRRGAALGPGGTLVPPRSQLCGRDL